MTEAERRARRRLEPIVEGLEVMRGQLQQVIVDLPPPEEEPAAAAVALPDLLRCVLVDRLTPAIAELRRLVKGEG
jgi:hypothetical protein